jgi:hypothetical protein
MERETGIEPATSSLGSYLAPSESADEKMVSRIFVSWSQLDGWLRHPRAIHELAGHRDLATTQR